MKKQIKKSVDKIFITDINKNLNLLIILKIDSSNKIQ